MGYHPTVRVMYSRSSMRRFIHFSRMCQMETLKVFDVFF
jgi:hypothetical protein